MLYRIEYIVRFETVISKSKIPHQREAIRQLDPYIEEGHLILSLLPRVGSSKVLNVVCQIFHKLPAIYNKNKNILKF